MQNTVNDSASGMKGGANLESNASLSLRHLFTVPSGTFFGSRLSGHRCEEATRIEINAVVYPCGQPDELRSAGAGNVMLVAWFAPSADQVKARLEAQTRLRVLLSHKRETINHQREK